MSFSSLSSVSSADPSLSGAPVVDPSLEPANVRHGTAQAKQAYATGLAFEQLLVDQLSQQLADTASSGDTGADGSDGSGESTTGAMSGDPATSTYAQMLPEALTSGVMSAGGLGIAAQIAASIDPALAAGR
jgi:hypothetical protein